MAPVRAEVEGFWLTEYENAPSPVELPLAAIQLAWLDVVQTQPEPVVTVTLPAPPLAGMEALAGEIA
jgi:hypothetical protein